MQCESFEWNELPPPSISNHDTATTLGPPLKRHAACDECRKRKLKCSGEATGCNRCLKQSLVCHYSIQKQMGRPPKKRVREDNDMSMYSMASNELWTDSDCSQCPSSGVVGADATDLSDALTFPHLLSTDDNHNSLWELDHGKALTPVPATASPWPDFSSVSEATSNVFTVPPGLAQMNAHPLSPSSSDSNSNQQCTCLSYIYLCLSHLASLAPFPVSQHTLCSLFMAARTAQVVIRCQTCPTIVAAAIQNVMFTGTLLNVIADAWMRVLKADAAELGREAAPPAYVASLLNSPNPTKNWNDWLRQTVRSAITGGPADPAGQVQCSDSPTLLSLIEEMEARQRRWHQLRLNSSQVPIDEHNEHDMLCLRVVKSVRDAVAKFHFAPHEYPEGVVPV